MSGLRKYNGHGPEEYYRRGRIYRHEPKAFNMNNLNAVHDVQMENCLLLPWLRSVIPLIDADGTWELDLHKKLKKQIIDRIHMYINKVCQLEYAMRDFKLKELLVKSFSLIRVKTLRPIVMTILRRTPAIDNRYLRVLTNDPTLYSESDIEVKRQIWRRNESLFSEEVGPLLVQYLREKEHILYDQRATQDAFFYETPKTRRQSWTIQRLAYMIGKRVELYDMVVQNLRVLFWRTRNAHYCTMRAEILMVFHDLEQHNVFLSDPCHKFVRYLDLCIKEKFVDLRRIRKLHSFLDTMHSSNDRVICDMAMVLCDPFAINFLGRTATKIMYGLAMYNRLPRENATLLLLLRLLTFGLKSWVMLDSNEYHEPRHDDEMVTKFLPSLVAIMMDDQARWRRCVFQVQQEELAEYAVNEFVQKSTVASIFVMYYTLQRARQKDIIGMLRLLRILARSRENCAFEDAFLYSLIVLLLPMSSEFNSETFCVTIFDKFFRAGLDRMNVKQHIFKLLRFVDNYLPVGRLDALLNTLNADMRCDLNSQKFNESSPYRKNELLPVQQEPTNQDLKLSNQNLVDYSGGRF